MALFVKEGQVVIVESNDVRECFVVTNISDGIHFRDGSAIPKRMDLLKLENINVDEWPNPESVVA